MSDRVRVVNGDRSFAWLEFEDMRDGVAFAAAFQGAGWVNLLEGLRRKPGPAGQTAFVDDRRDVTVRVCASPAAHEQGTIWFADDGDSFAREWAQNPGVSATQHTLMSGTEDATRRADLLVVSGHGSKGRVYGQALGRVLKEDPPGERRWYIANIFADREAPRGRRLKYLILPCCTNAGLGVAPMWLPAFQDRAQSEVLHGVLGYAQAYPGDEIGARIMRTFAGLVFPEKVHGAPPPDEKTILQCWAEANERNGAGWGAVMLAECAKRDTMSQWVSSAGLPDPEEIVVKQYDGYTTRFPAPLDDGDGIVVSDAPPDHEARFWVSKRGDAQDNLQLVDGLVTGWDGVEHIRCGNNDNFIDPQLGLDAGRLGKLVLSARSGTFTAGTTMTVVVYVYRETHEGVDLPSLLSLRLSPSQQRRLVPLVDANRRKPASDHGHVDAFHYTFDDADDEARWELANGRAELLFQVAPDAPDRNPDRSTAHSCGFFWLDVVPPRVLEGPLDHTPVADMPRGPDDRAAIGAYLRTAVHEIAHGVHLHRGLPSPDDLAGFEDALALLRARYDDAVRSGAPIA